MCSRFELNLNALELMARFRLRVPPPLPNRPIVRPTDLALCLLPGTEGLAARLLPWGLQVEWEKRPLINARAETLEQKPTFRRLLERRILVPATSYTEWRAEGRARIPNHIRPADGKPFTFAGLTDEQDRFTIITCAAPPAIGHIHDRMPAILPDAGAEAAWLDPGIGFPEVRDLLRPYAGDLEVAEEGVPPPAQGELF